MLLLFANSKLSPAAYFGSALIQWWDANAAGTVTTDTGAPATTISQIANLVSGGAAMLTNAKANQPNLITTDLGGINVVHHDTFAKNMWANFTLPANMSVFTLYHLDAYTTGFNNRRHISSYVGNGDDFGGIDRAILHMQNAQLTSLRSFANNVFLDPGYSLATGAYGVTSIVANDTENTMTIFRNGSSVSTGAWTGGITGSTRFGVGKDTGAAAAQYSLVQRWPEMFIINRAATAADIAYAQSYFKQRYPTVGLP